MDIITFSSDRLVTALRGLRAAAPLPTPRQVLFLETIARLHRAEIDVSALKPLPMWLVAVCLPDFHQRKRLVQLAAIMVTVDGHVTHEAALAVEQLANALHIHEPAVRTLRRIAAGQKLRTRMDLMRRIMGKVLGRALREEGWRGVAKIISALIGRGEDEATAERYSRLRRFPKGSLGRALFDHCDEHGFPLPGGGPRAIPERLLFHDIGHVLSGYATDPAGEIQQAAFQAGFVRDDGFAFLFFGIVQFHLGIKVTPVAEPERGHFDIEKVLFALARGAACEQDLSDRWDFWSHASRPLAQLRAELSIAGSTAGARATTAQAV